MSDDFQQRGGSPWGTPPGGGGSGNGSGRGPTPPDIDKIIRAVMDAMTYSGVIKDDANCYLIMSRKMYCNNKEQPGVFGIISDTQSCDNI